MLVRCKPWSKWVLNKGSGSEWLVMTKNAAFIAEEIRLKRATQLNNVETILWTDDFKTLH